MSLIFTHEPSPSTGDCNCIEDLFMDAKAQVLVLVLLCSAAFVVTEVLEHFYCFL